MTPTLPQALAPKPLWLDFGGGYEAGNSVPGFPRAGRGGYGLWWLVPSLSCGYLLHRIWGSGWRKICILRVPHAVLILLNQTVRIITIKLSIWCH